MRSWYEFLRDRSQSVFRVPGSHVSSPSLATSTLSVVAINTPVLEW